MARIARTTELPLGEFSFQGIGWDKSRIFWLGRASWKLVRDGFNATKVVYRNLIQQEDWELGPFSPGVTDLEVLQWIADQGDSIRPGDWILIKDRVLAFSIDRGQS